MAVTRKQLEEVANNLFDEMDLDKNGRLEKNEVRKFSEETMKLIKPDAAFDEEAFEIRFNKLDKDANGYVDRSELFQSMYDEAEKLGTLADGGSC